MQLFDIEQKLSFAAARNEFASATTGKSPRNAALRDFK
jgi:hypothetical protein